MKADNPLLHIQTLPWQFGNPVLPKTLNSTFDWGRRLKQFQMFDIKNPPVYDGSSTMPVATAAATAAVAPAAAPATPAVAPVKAAATASAAIATVNAGTTAAKATAAGGEAAVTPAAAGGGGGSETPPVVRAGQAAMKRAAAVGAAGGGAAGSNQEQHAQLLQRMNAAGFIQLAGTTAIDPVKDKFDEAWTRSLNLNDTREGNEAKAKVKKWIKSCSEMTKGDPFSKMIGNKLLAHVKVITHGRTSTFRSQDKVKKATYIDQEIQNYKIYKQSISKRNQANKSPNKQPSPQQRPSPQATPRARAK